MLVESDSHGQRGHAGTDRRDGAHHSASTGGTTVRHVDEGNSGQTEKVRQRIRVAGVMTTTEGHTDVVPADAGIPQGCTNGIGPLLQPRQAVRPPKRMNSDSDDRDTVAHRDTGAGAKANVNTCWPSGVVR